MKLITPYRAMFVMGLVIIGLVWTVIYYARDE